MAKTTKQKTVEYIDSQLYELTTMARERGLAVLVYLFEMAALETANERQKQQLKSKPG